MWLQVKDVRCGWDTSDAAGFLEGNHLDDVIAATLQWRAEQAERGVGGDGGGGGGAELQKTS